MKATILCSMFCLCFSQSVLANLDGDWVGEEFAKTTIKIQGLSISSFGISHSQLTVNAVNKSMIFTDDLGNFQTVFNEKIKTKRGLIQQHTFSCKFDKASLQAAIYDNLSLVLGGNLLISNFSVSSSAANGEELNESDENLNESDHAIHGMYKITVNFKVAEFAYPARKVPVSVVFDVDFGLLRSSNVPSVQAAILDETAPPLLENTAQIVKQLFTRFVAE